MGPRGTATLGTKVYIENFDDGTISVIDTVSDTVTATVDVGHSPAGMGVSGTDIYLSRFQDNELSILDTTTNTLQALPVFVPPSSGGGNGGGGGVVLIPQTTPVIPVNPNTIPTTDVPQIPVIHTFKDHLRLHSRGPEVLLLQKYLNTHGFLIAKSGAGSPGKETNLFGSLTKGALIRFQKANKLTPDGVLGPLTRGRVNSLQ
jgi:YVTN family beta-propeller protein